MSALTELARIGVVVHPTREIDRALDGLRGWAGENDAEVVQVAVDGQEREVADKRSAEECDLVVAIGGDGTMLAAIAAAAPAGRPVMGVACGSLGVLTTVTAGDAGTALAAYAAGDWSAREIPALAVRRDDGDDPLTAINDVAITRGGQGQVTTAATIDDVLYARFVGDGFVVTTPIGSSGYTLAAGGPLLAPGANAFALTPLANHGGSVPPLVVGADSTLRLDVTPGYGGIRFELDGRMMEPELESLTVTLRPRTATIVEVGGEHSILTALRRRKIIMDSPRVLARDKREGSPED
jgi:NAD+ kinase